MIAPRLLVENITIPTPRGSKRTAWQYHSRSDRHSKVACWGVMVDLLATSAMLRDHARAGKVVFGVNHEMRDFKQNRSKNLDLVIARPAGDQAQSQGQTLMELADSWSLYVSPGDRDLIQQLPIIREGTVGPVLVALEAKAAMTEHSKARPRLFDELNSSHLTVHGASSRALAVGLVIVNASTTFISPGRNPDPSVAANITKHKQPKAVVDVIDKVKELPRRTQPDQAGFDALSIIVVTCANDGSVVTVETAPPAPQPGDIFEYQQSIARLASEYDTTFSNI